MRQNCTGIPAGFQLFLAFSDAQTLPFRIPFKPWWFFFFFLIFISGADKEAAHLTRSCSSSGLPEMESLINFELAGCTINPRALITREEQADKEFSLQTSSA